MYGDKTEQYIDRGAEVKLFPHSLSDLLKVDSIRSFKVKYYLLKVENMKLLESGGNGAKLYATFENGLAYEVPAKIILKELYENQIYGWRDFYTRLWGASKIYLNISKGFQILLHT